MTEATKTESTKKTSKVTIMIFLAVFTLPVILAKLALDNGWFNTAATNNGELLKTPGDFSVVNTLSEKKWHLLYVIPADCQAECENAIYSLNQVWVALGKQMDRVSPVVLSTPSSDPLKVAAMQEHKSITLLAVNEQSVNQVFKDAPTDGIFLVDTLDNVILRYPLQKEQQQAVLHSREILADLRKLLKLSRIG